MTGEFKGARVIVTGGSRSIGRGIALAFAREGAAISVCARGEASLRSVGAELSAIGPSHVAVCDLADGAAIKRYVAEAAEALGGIDILINNATSLARGNDDADWESDFAVDLLASVRMMRAVGPWLQKSRYRSILNFASISAFHQTSNAPAYGAIKAAVVHITQTEAMLQAPHRIRVNAIAPGSTESDDNLWGERKRAGDPAYDRKLARMPLGRLGTPADIALVALFMSSDKARWITGQTIIVDGGELAGGG